MLNVEFWLFLYFAAHPSIEGPFFSASVPSHLSQVEKQLQLSAPLWVVLFTRIHSIKASLNPPLFNIPIEKYAFNFIIFITGFYCCCHHCYYHGNELSCLSTSYLEMGNPSLTFILYLGNTVKAGWKIWKTKRMETSEID